MEYSHAMQKADVHVCIDVQRASPARHGTATGRHDPMGVGPTRHEVPCEPCRHGLHAWPTAQARPAGPFFVPGRPEKHG